jgi:hypothetical protein
VAAAILAAALAAGVHIHPKAGPANCLLSSITRSRSLGRNRPSLLR